MAKAKPNSKFKPHKGLLKRIRVTKSGMIKGRIANGSHLRSQKSPKTLRNMRKGRFLQSYGIRKRINRLLGVRVPSAKRQAKAAVETAATE
jgi:ribosomal protein L35